jgi:hypothetical protein
MYGGGAIPFGRGDALTHSPGHAADAGAAGLKLDAARSLLGGGEGGHARDCFADR